MKNKSAAECIGFRLGWDMRDVSAQRYQAGKQKYPVYNIGDEYVCCPPAGASPPEGWNWKQNGEAYGRPVYFAAMNDSVAETRPVRMTKFQRNELFYLLNDIMSEGFDDDGNTLEGYMSDHYGFVNKDEFDVFTAKLGKNLKAPSVVIQMTAREAQCTWGEFENRYDIEINNSDEPNDEYAKAARAAVLAMKRVEEAFPDETFKA